MAHRGTDPGEGTSGVGAGDFLDLEAEVTGDESSGGEDDSSDDNSLIDFFDDETDQAPGNPMLLFQQQQAEEDARQVAEIKRKHLRTPDKVALHALSPKLIAMTISPPRVPAKKKLFEEDSGVGVSLELSHEAVGVIETIRPQVEGDPTQGREEPEGEESVQLESLECTPNLSGREEGLCESSQPAAEQLPNEADLGKDEGSELAAAILRARNKRACMYAEFKAVYGVSLTDLARQFKSDKTCCRNWVTVVYGLHESYYETLCGVLPEHCTYTHMQHIIGDKGPIVLMLLEFKATKNRDTVKKLLKSITNVNEERVILNPPNIRLPAAALYWVQRANSRVVTTTGTLPEWIAKQTMLGCLNSEDAIFDFSRMVQWAYDQNLTDEARIAYMYAQHADEDKNAQAWLASTSQAKHVRDCAQMVRYYKQAQQAEMTMPQWIYERCEQTDQEGDWKHVVQFLRQQLVEIIPFLGTLRDWLKGKPKKNTICIHGPPDTGKSMFGMSLMHFLHGAIISFANARSHFWLMPLTTAKVAMLDDATEAAWNYIDSNLRNMPDGNPLSFDIKHRTPVQTTSPPLLITSNIDITKEDRHKYLRSRVKCFKFDVPLPLGADGNPKLVLTDGSWKCFFRKFQTGQSIVL
uniref:Replication protein E1 n=1 Tax=Rousettus bat papillomavirus TaxID=3141903 RepID=A0AAU7E1Z3_9PAPI